MKYALLVCSCLFLMGCSTAGPFVSNISSDGRGNLIVEKSSAEYNAFLGVVGNKGDRSTETINVGCPNVDVKK